ncbi:MAG: hypothetical protein ACI96W_002749 [Paraglaciecola sp.]|jgi:hypothetical protein
MYFLYGFYANYDVYLPHENYIFPQGPFADHSKLRIDEK